MQYTLKDGSTIESIPVGKSSVIIGEKNSKNTLEVVARAPIDPNLSSRSARVICKCICGNFTVLSINSFRSETTISCGCLNKELHRETCRNIGKQSYFKDYTKVNNPYYTFIERLDEKDSCNSAYWIIQCKNCGQQYKAVPAQLISDKRPRGLNPCSCYRGTSKGALKIEKLLSENGIAFEKEKTFPDCISPKGNCFKYDFWVNNEYLIEYDGEQHFLPQKFGSDVNGEEKLKIQKEYDLLKNKWCKDKNISLIRIPYTHFKDIKIEDLILETSNFII